MLNAGEQVSGASARVAYRNGHALPTPPNDALIGWAPSPAIDASSILS
jgi:hypothetical protein